LQQEVDFLYRQIAHSISDQQLRFNFTQRAVGDAQMMREFLSRAAALALGAS